MKDDAGTVRLLETEWAAVPVTVLPTSDNSLDLGSAAKSWRTIYIDTSIVLGAAASKIVPGATSFAIRNNADNANNLIITDAGAATVRTSLTVTTSANIGTTLIVQGNENVFGASSVGSGTIRPITVSQSTGAIVRLHTTLTGNGHSTSTEEAGIQFTTDDTDWSAGSVYASMVTLAENAFGTAYSLIFKNSSQSDGGNDEQMRLTSAGRLGIGTTSPVGRLHVYDTDGGMVHLRTSGVSTTPVTLLTGVTDGVYITGMSVTSAGNRTLVTAYVTPGGTSSYSPTGSITFEFALSVGGDLTFYRTAGAVTASLSVMAVYR